MIQRRQTVFLILGALLLLGFFLFDLAWTSRVAQVYPWFTPAIAGLGGLTALTALVAVFLYKDRKKQRSVVLAVQFLGLAFMIVLYGSVLSLGASPFSVGDGADPGLLVAAALPIGAYICFFLARRGIEQDIALIRSMDRLR